MGNCFCWLRSAIRALLLLSFCLSPGIHTVLVVGTLHWPVIYNPLQWRWICCKPFWICFPLSLRIGTQGCLCESFVHSHSHIQRAVHSDVSCGMGPSSQLK